MDIVEINNTCAPNAEAHSYPHVASLVEIVEINNTPAPNNLVEPAEVLSASASSVNYNEFERFLDEDRMWGIHRPATRKPSISSTKIVGKKQFVLKEKSDEEDSKKVATGASVAIANAPEGAVNACISSDPLQPDDIISQRERNLSTE